jgi:hypothetical protein
MMARDRTRPNSLAHAKKKKKEKKKMMMMMMTIFQPPNPEVPTNSSVTLTCYTHGKDLASNSSHGLKSLGVVRFLPF